MQRLVSFALFIVVWAVAAQLLGAPRLPGPVAVLLSIVEETKSGDLPFNLGVTMLRVAAAFVIAMSIGTAIGFAMGRRRAIDNVADAWLVILLNLPALVIIDLTYLWVGLTETAGILAVVINKLPNTIVVVREGARTLDRGLEEMSQVFAFDRWKALRHVIAPQLVPYFAAAARSGLSLIWKIVLVAEFLGLSNGIGVEINVAFTQNDVTRMLAYTVPFVIVMLSIESLVVQPLERRASRWRLRPA